MRYFIFLVIIFNFFAYNSFGGSRSHGVLFLKKNEYPNELTKYNASYILIISSFNQKGYRYINGDSVTDIKVFIDSTGFAGHYRLVYARNNDQPDSVAEYSTTFTRTMSASLSKNYLLKGNYYSDNGETGGFVVNYTAHMLKLYRLTDDKSDKKIGNWALQFEIIDDYDKVHFSTGNIWVLSVGVNNYGSIKLHNCVTDAQSFADFFENEANTNLSGNFTKFVLTDQYATKDSIIHCLDYIIAHAQKNDYFILNFSGFTTSPSPDNKDSLNDQIYFIPYGAAHDTLNYLTIKNNEDRKQLISLNYFDRKVQLIQADKQLFVLEAGHTKNFKKEFINGLMQDADNILNANRVIIVPNNFGRDDFDGIQKGPLNYFITSCRSSNIPGNKPGDTVNIYDIFNENQRQKICYKIKKAEFSSNFFDEDYFDIFFVKDFYKDMENYSGESNSRGLHLEPDKQHIIAKYAVKKVALVIGTDSYKTPWHKLSNAIFDATSVADELNYTYGYKVKLLKDADMDSVLNAIRDLYTELDSTSQLLVYFAGHGYLEKNLYDDGFIVCHDSKSLDIDPNMNTYIPFTKIKKMINRLPARQIMVVLDICYGGAFDDDVLGTVEKKYEGDDSRILNIPTMQRLSDWSKYKTRIQLSSVGEVPADDGQAGKHSPFAEQFLRLLRTDQADGILTASKIYSVLDDISLQGDVNNKFQPHKGHFGDNQAFGEFVLIPLPVVKPDAVADKK